MQYKISDSTAQKLATEWALQKLGHSLGYYSTADALMGAFLPKYNEAMEAVEKYNQSADS